MKFNVFYVFNAESLLVGKFNSLDDAVFFCNGQANKNWLTIEIRDKHFYTVVDFTQIKSEGI